ncbi:MAG: hypothetical protein ACPHXR_04060 [Flavicella sp.]
MKKLLFIILLGFVNLTNAQSIAFNLGNVTDFQVGKTVTIPYTYSMDQEAYIYCAINEYDANNNWIRYVAKQDISNQKQGTTFEKKLFLKIPEKTVKTSDLKSKHRYVLQIEIKNQSDFTWRAGDSNPISLN